MLTVLIVLAVAHLVLCAVHPLRRRVRWLARLYRRDTISLLPDWRLFAPGFPQQDPYLLVRERTADAEDGVSPWRTIVDYRRQAQGFLYHPQWRWRHLLRQCAADVTTLARSGSGEVIERSAAYQYLAAFVATLGAPPAADGGGPAETLRQFAVVYAPGFATRHGAQRRITYLSGWLDVASVRAA